MAISIKMKYSDMDVSIDLTNTEGYEVNNSNLLSKIEELLDHLSLYSHVSVVIESEGEQEENDIPKYSLNRYFNDINPTDTIPSIRTDSTMNG